MHAPPGVVPALPPMVVFGPFADTPPLLFGSRVRPSAVVPMKLPCTISPLGALTTTGGAPPPGVKTLAKALTPVLPLPEITLRSAADVPPTTTFGADIVRPPPAFGSAVMPLAVVPIKLFLNIVPEPMLMITPLLLLARARAPWLLLPEIRLRDASATPPIRLSGDWLETPVWFGTAAVPVASVPMKLPSIVLLPSGPSSRMPLLPEKPLITRPRMVECPPLSVKPLLEPDGPRTTICMTALVPIAAVLGDDPGCVKPSIVTGRVMVGSGVAG